jgi:hypothetical protein
MVICPDKFRHALANSRHTWLLVWVTPLRKEKGLAGILRSLMKRIRITSEDFQ